MQLWEMPAVQGIMKLFYIYCHTNTVTGMKYVGQTSKTMEKRWVEHKYNALRRSRILCRYFHAAIRAYGPGAFSHEVLDVLTTASGANAAERAWIRHLGCRAPDGYNLDVGGGVSSHSDETRKLMRDSHLRLNAARSPERRREISSKGRQSMTPERRRDIALRREASKTPETRAEIARKIASALAALSPEKKAERLLKIRATRALSSEQIRANIQASWDRVPPERRGDRAIKGAVSQTPEQRRDRSLRAYATRRARGHEVNRCVCGKISRAEGPCACGRCRKFKES